MSELKKAVYKGTYKTNTFDILCWEGTPLGHVWNSIKSFYLPGDIVIIKNDRGQIQKFMKGVC